jgi:uncharacterized protein (DUF1778 family)
MIPSGIESIPVLIVWQTVTRYINPYTVRIMLESHFMQSTTSTHERIDLRTSSEVKELIARAASTAGMSLSAFLISSAQERAKQILNESESITLSAKDWNAFFKGLDVTDKPRPMLTEALRNHQSWVHMQKSK